MTPISEEAINEPIVEAAITPVVESVVPQLEERRYEYQPTDADGRPMGGKQVIVYRTQDELTFKLANQSTELLRKLREVTRKNTLGIFDEDSSAEDRHTGPQEFKPRMLTPDERVQLSLDILDPENFDRAVNTVFEASVGTSTKGLADKLTQLELDNRNFKAIRESDRFMSANPSYVKCKENGDAIAAWVERKGYAPTAENFQKAYDTLLSQNVLVTSLEVIPQPEFHLPEPVVEPLEPVIVPDAPARESIPPENQAHIEPTPKAVISRVPTGLSRNNSSDAGTVQPIGDDIIYQYVQRDGSGRQVGEARVFKGRAAIDAMPSDEYKRRLLGEPGFAAKVEKLNRKG